MNKVCSVCGEAKPSTAEFFQRRASHSSGLMAACKLCVSARATQKRPQKARSMRDWRAKNPDRVKENGKRYRVKNADRVREQMAARYKAKKPEYYAAVAAWRLKNPDKYLAIQKATDANLRAKRAGRPGRLRGADILTKKDEQRGRCYWCLADIHEAYVIDHVVPLSRGGSNAPQNIVCACATCNSSKGAHLPDEWPRLAERRRV